jgi:hypothetical protein
LKHRDAESTEKREGRKEMQKEKRGDGRPRRGQTGGPRGKPEVGQGLCVRAFQSGERKRRGGRECLLGDDRKSV